MRNTRRSRVPVTAQALALAFAAAVFPAAGNADPATGTINYQSKAGAVIVKVANVYLIKGPDAVSGKTIRELIFTSADIGAKLQACASMMCASGHVIEGMTVASNLTLTLAPPIAPWSMVKVPARRCAVSAVALRVSSGLAVPEY